jgi:hypothetical protein
MRPLMITLLITLQVIKLLQPLLPCVVGGHGPRVSMRAGNSKSEATIGLPIENKQLSSGFASWDVLQLSIDTCMSF